MQSMPRPDVVRCFTEETFEPHLPAMELRWDPDAPGVAERVWYLPENVCLKGPAPRHFGVCLTRHGPNAYRLRVLWNGLCLSWERLSRTQIMASSLSVILEALGTDIWYLLSQPIVDETPSIALAA